MTEFSGLLILIILALVVFCYGSGGFLVLKGIINKLLKKDK